MSNKELINISEAANFIGKCTKTIRRYVKSGKLKSQKIGKALFFRKEDLELIIKNHHELNAVQSNEHNKEKDNEETFDLKENNNIVTFFQQTSSDVIEGLSILNKKIDDMVSSKCYQTKNNNVRESSFEENKKLENKLEKIINEENSNLIADKEKSMIYEQEKEIKILKSIIESNKKGISLLKDEINNKNTIIKNKDKEMLVLTQKIEQLQMSIGSMESEIKKTRTTKSLREIITCNLLKRRK